MTQLKRYYSYEPYEREAMGEMSHKIYQASRERLLERLVAFYRQLGRFSKAAKLIEEASKKNKNGLPW